MRRAVLTIAALACGLWSSLTAGADNAGRLVPWLDVPASWSRVVENGIVSLMPNDLPPGRTLLLMVEPETASSDSPNAAYDKAVRDLGPWEPIGTPDTQKSGGWTFRQGVGVVTLNGVEYIGHTIVARHAGRMVRQWALADSDATYNRYKSAIGTALSSVQDITQAPAAAPATPPQPAQQVARATPTTDAGKLPAGFGKGLSGVYVGVERGLSASASVGAGTQQVFNPSTGQYETSATGTAPQPGAQIGDYLEVDVFYPDGTYRRRLPIRGLMSDLNWERTQIKNLWGTWRQEGNQIVVQRGNYTARYTVDGEALTSGRGNIWVKLPLHTNLRLDGTWARADFRDADAPRLTLRADGTYREHDRFLRMVGSAWHLVEPDADAMIGHWNDNQFLAAMSPSAGTYSFDNFTLTLRASDGRIWQINAYVPAGESAPRPKRLVINGRVLVRD